MSIISTIAFITLVISGIIILFRDRIVAEKMANGTKEFIFSTDINWSKSLKHTLIMYFGSITILLWPLISAQKPQMDDVFQAFIFFLGAYYLKNLYLKSE